MKVINIIYKNNGINLNKLLYRNFFQFSSVNNENLLNKKLKIDKSAIQVRF